MGINNKWIKNFATNYSIESLINYFSKIKLKPTSREEYEKQRYFETKKELVYKGDNLKHNFIVEKIYNNPAIIGITDKFYNAETEVNFFYKDIQKGAVDILIETKNNIYAIEYKCRHTKNNRRHAKIQLKKAKKYIKKNFGTDITKLLYVSGNVDFEEIVPKK